MTVCAQSSLKLQFAFHFVGWTRAPLTVEHYGRRTRDLWHTYYNNQPRLYFFIFQFFPIFVISLAREVAQWVQERRFRPQRRKRGMVIEYVSLYATHVGTILMICPLEISLITRHTWDTSGRNCIRKEFVKVSNKYSMLTITNQDVIAYSYF